jgi:mono/diheme cytochrome c family protein
MPPESFSQVGYASLLTIGIVALAAAMLQAQQPTPAAPSSSAVPPNATGEDIYRAACATCHGVDGTGVSRDLVGFAQDLPDFTDCRFATPEPSADWAAVVHEGGPIRGLDRHMPAFGDALTRDEIQRVVAYVSRFCTDAAWPRGDLNLPRPFFTEKAYPENEAVVTTSVGTSGDKQVGNALLYERRIGKRNQIEVVVPLDALQRAGQWTAGLGDIAVGFKRALYASVDTGRIVSAGGEIVLPTGRPASGLGSGTTVFEPFVLFGQAVGATGFVQAHAAFEWPADRAKAAREAVIRAAVGNSFLQERGFGRAWTPMAEILWARPEGGPSEWDVVPQMQVTLSKLQHVAVAAGARIPLNGRNERRPQLVMYFLWDWFDGSLLDFWR